MSEINISYGHYLKLELDRVSSCLQPLDQSMVRRFYLYFLNNNAFGFPTTTGIALLNHAFLHDTTLS